MPGTFQYQGVAETIVFSSSTPSTSVDKWFSETDFIQRSPYSRVSWAQDDGPSGSGIIFKETAQLDKFLGDQEPPPRPLKRELTNHGGFSQELGVFTKETVFLDKFEGYEEPSPRQRKREQDYQGDFSFGEGVFTKESVSVDRFIGNQEPPPRQRRREQDNHGDFSTELGVFTKESTGLDKWFQHDWYPEKYKTRMWLGDFSQELGKFTLETVFLDKWYPRFPDPPRAVPTVWRQPYIDPTPKAIIPTIVSTPVSSYHEQPDLPFLRLKSKTFHSDLAFGEGVFNKETIFLDKWIGREDPSPRQVKRELESHGDFGYGEGKFVLETVSQDRWATQPDLPFLRVRARVYQTDPAFTVGAVVPSPGHTGDWQTLPPELSWLKRTFKTFETSFFYGEGVFTKELISLDKWETTSPEVSFTYKRLSREYQTLPAFTVGAVTPSAGGTGDWMNFSPELPWCKKSVRVFLTDLSYGEGVFTRETVSGDRWYTQCQDPPRQLKRLSPDDTSVWHPIKPVVIEIVTLDKWYQEVFLIPARLSLREPLFCDGVFFLPNPLKRRTGNSIPGWDGLINPVGLSGWNGLINPTGISGWDGNINTPTVPGNL